MSRENNPDYTTMLVGGTLLASTGQATDTTIGLNSQLAGLLLFGLWKRRKPRVSSDEPAERDFLSPTDAASTS